jgi:hypothetical protein
MSAFSHVEDALPRFASSDSRAYASERLLVAEGQEIKPGEQRVRTV